jgi:uncharacterized protein (DUF1501 family)
MNRRFFLKSGSVALASVGMSLSAPSFLERAVLAHTRNRITGGKRKTLIAIFQRGAVDGLNMVVPFGESSYYDARPGIAIPKPSSGNQEAAIDLNGFFGLHPSMSPLKSLWDSKRLAIIHAAGSPDNTRSHFDAQDYMESATPGVKSTTDGWLNRYLQSKKDDQSSLFRAVSLTQTMPRVLQGRAPAIAITNLSNFAIRAGRASESVQGGFEAIYARATNEMVAGAGRETLDAINYLKEVNPAQYKPENGAEYPRNPFGNSLLQIAQLIKAEDCFHGRRRLGHAREPGQRSRATRQSVAAVQLRTRRALSGSGPANGRRRRINDVGVWPHCQRERQSRHGPRPRERDVCHGQRRARRSGLRQVARSKERSALRRTRPCADDRLPRRVC